MRRAFPSPKHLSAGTQRGAVPSRRPTPPRPSAQPSELGSPCNSCPCITPRKRSGASARARWLNPSLTHAHAGAAELRAQPLEEGPESLVVVDVRPLAPWRQSTAGTTRQPLCVAAVSAA